MKTVATYTGKVTKLAVIPELSQVTLTEEATGKTLETSAVTQKLLERNILEGESFKVTIYQSADGKVIGELEKL